MLRGEAEATRNTNLKVFGRLDPGLKPQSTALNTTTLTNNSPMHFQFSGSRSSIGIHYDLKQINNRKLKKILF